MASYSKRMVEVAQTWLVVNKDPLSPWVNIPGLDKSRAASSPVTIPNRARYEKAAKTRPEIAAGLAEIDRMEVQRQTGCAEVQQLEKKVEELINVAPTPGQHKHPVEDEFRTDIGRWCLAWARDGHNVFDLGVDFAAAMLLTDAREIDIASVRLPFRGLLMIVPDGFARGIEGGHYTKIHITEIPRAQIKALDVCNRIAAILGPLDPGITKAVLDEVGSKPLGMGATGHRLTDNLVNTYADPEDTAFHIYVSDGTHVLDTLIERRGLTWDSFDTLPDDVVEDVDRAARHTIRQIVFGTLAYISAVEHATELRAPIGKKRAARDGDAPKIHDVGRTIRLDPHLVRAARSGSREVALRLKHRHIVRGHYRNQPFGPRRAEVKRIWLTPFWKGPEDGAELVHTYLIDKR